MTRLFTFLFLLILPLISFSQGQNKDYIDWLSLEKAQEYSKKYNKNMLIYFYRSNCEFCEKMKLTGFGRTFDNYEPPEVFFGAISRGSSEIVGLKYSDMLLINFRGFPGINQY